MNKLLQKSLVILISFSVLMGTAGVEVYAAEKPNERAEQVRERIEKARSKSKRKAPQRKAPVRKAPQRKAPKKQVQKRQTQERPTQRRQSNDRKSQPRTQKSSRSSHRNQRPSLADSYRNRRQEKSRSRYNLEYASKKVIKLGIGKFYGGTTITDENGRTVHVIKVMKNGTMKPIKVDAETGRIY